MTSRGVRIGLLGATGALGGEVLVALDESPLRIAEIVPLASDRSLGEEIDFQGTGYPVLAETPSLRGLDLVFCCAPAEASLVFVREALRAEVPCIDCSGALLDSDDVPLRVAGLAPPPEGEGAPVVSTPGAALLAWTLALGPLHRAAGLRRVVATVLESASAAGRDGIVALSTESLALFNQQEPPEPVAFGRPLAFDCHPALEPPDDQGHTLRERALQRGLTRLLAAPIEVAVTVTQVPTFVGQATALALELERPLDPKEAEDYLAQAPSVEVWSLGSEGPNLRAAAGRDVVIAGRVRRHEATPHGLLLWLVADPLRLSALNAVALAVSRLQPN
jgi:aspartate-semialdehyde dehydrogenase